ncbi:transcriptional regulator [Pseudorhodoferax aquiterrae]|uniref:Transcriptional regulator n=1 Tax=Pseudorhodoferax aquiterrae TaxID=747304 RepID=A0ABQ3GA07_9BURK|nr:transcriptional regulator [Pseudorhodoferax aquiterrae]GHC97168.1 transcriptional regulator [Pseudorhodoferax aquiterrae]
MNVRDVAGHWVALHEALGLGAPIADEAAYAQVLAFIDQVFDQVAADPAHPLGGLVELLADRVREYEDRVHPWPDTSTPASVLASLMEEHGLKQSDLPEIGAQSVVSAVLAGKRALNLRQVKALAQRFSVPMEMLA